MIAGATFEQSSNAGVGGQDGDPSWKLPATGIEGQIWREEKKQTIQTICWQYFQLHAKCIREKGKTLFDQKNLLLYVLGDILILKVTY